MQLAINAQRQIFGDVFHHLRGHVLTDTAQQPADQQDQAQSQTEQMDVQRKASGNGVVPCAEKGPLLAAGLKYRRQSQDCRKHGVGLR